MPFPKTPAPTLQTWQYSYNGLLLGKTTPYDVTKITGLDLPKIRSNDINRAREHGQFIGLDLMTGRDVTLSGDFSKDTVSLQHAAEALATAFHPGATTEVTLWMKLANLPTLGTVCRTRRKAVPVDLGYSVSALASMAVQVHASDPRLYASPLSASCSVGTPLGGLTFPATFPLAFSSGSVAGSIMATNAGNIETRPIFTIYGPVTSPTVANSTTGWSLTFTNPTQTSYTVLAGDTLVVNTDTHSITYFSGGGGTGASRRSWLVAGSSWPSTSLGIGGLAPGNNTVQFTSKDTSAVAASLTLKWASAYLI